MVLKNNIIFVVYKTFMDWPESKIPVGAYMNVIDAVKASERLMAERTRDDVMSGMQFYADTRGVTVHGESN